MYNKDIILNCPSFFTAVSAPTSLPKLCVCVSGCCWYEYYKFLLL